MNRRERRRIDRAVAGIVAPRRLDARPRSRHRGDVLVPVGIAALVLLSKPHVVSFHTVFPKPGKYKVWGQFDVGGQMLIADFVVEVDATGAAQEAVADPHANHPH